MEPETPSDHPTMLPPTGHHPTATVDTDGRLLAIAPALAEALGVAPGSLIGTPLAAWLADEDSPRVREALAGDQPALVSAGLRGGGGQPLRPVQLACTPLLAAQGRMWSVEFRRANDAPAAFPPDFDHRLHSILDNLFTYIAITDLDGRIVDANRTASGLDGSALPGLLGKPVWDTGWIAHSPPMQAGVRAAVRAAAMGHTSRNDFTVRARDGSMHVVEGSIGPVRDASGRVVQVVCTAVDVTEREEARNALRSSEALLRQAQRIARLGSWEWDLQTDQLAWSDETYRILELEPTPENARREAFLARVHPDDRRRAASMYQEAVDAGTSLMTRLRLLLPGDRVRWIIVHCEIERTPTGEPAICRGTMQDITELVELREEAERVTHELARVVAASPLPIVVIDDRGIIRAVNPATKRTFGYDAPSLLNRNVALLMADDVGRDHDRFIAHYLATGQASTAEGLVIGRTREVHARRADGTMFPADLTVAETPQAGGGRRFVGILMDRTEWRAKEEQIIRMQKLEAVGSLIAGVAHDFNNLLTAILGGLDMGRARPGEERWLEVAQHAAERAAELVQRLLRFSRDEPATRIATAPGALADAVLALVRETLDRRIWIRAEVAESLPPIAVDPGQIEQVLLNHVVNARDAVLARATTESGDYRPTIVLSVAAEHRDGIAGIAFQVDDNGIGMTEEVRRRAFDPFFTTKPAESGTGLGLAMADNIIAAHGGQVSVRTAPNHGTTVQVWLPAGAAAPALRGATDGAGGVAGATSRRHVLLVDDEAMVGEVARAYLESAGFHVTFAASGDEAIALLREGTPFDLAVLDLNMPAPDGWAVLEVLRGLPAPPPVIVASGYMTDATVVAHGGTVVLHKPYSRADLLTAVRSILTL